MSCPDESEIEDVPKTDRRGEEPLKFNRRLMLGVTSSLVAIAVSGTAFAADYTLRIHTLVKSPHPYNDIATKMKTDIETGSSGQIEVEIFDSGQLGQDPAVIGEMGFGTIDLMVSSVSNAVQQVPEYGIFSMPYLFEGIDDAVSKIGPGTEVEAYYQQVYDDRSVGMKLLALGASGTRNMAAAEVSIEGLSDVSGLKMRTPPSPLDAQTWSALGMLPVTVAWGELYAAMQTGVAQAMESSLPGYTGAKLYEVAPNLALTGHTIQVNHVSMSSRSFDRLPEDLQKVVEAAAADATAYGVEQAKGYDAALVQALETEHGVTVSRPDTAPFVEALAPLQVDMAAELDLSEPYALLTK